MFPSIPDALHHSLSLALTAFDQGSSPARTSTLPESIRDSLAYVFAISPFVAQHCARQPEDLIHLAESGRLLARVAPEEYADLLRALTPSAHSETDWMRLIRQFRNREMVRIAWRDIAGWASLDDTLLELSWLAETLIESSLGFLFEQAKTRGPVPVDRHGAPQTLVVLGMGKLGAHELNFSSDIDLIFAYRDEGSVPDRKQTPYSEFYTRLARSLVKVLDTRTEDGFVFRVDTRLRPFGDSGPLVMNLDSMDIYYQGQAREWERYAMVKARVVAGDRAAGLELDAIIRPFVYRRYLDFRALGELRSLKQKITYELHRRDRLDNVKLGPGGIREIEFIGQAFQLIRGGQEPRLRARGILEILTSLAALNLLPETVVETLSESYRFLRRVENRLQQYADAQTHDLPGDPVQQAGLALAMGYPDWAQFTVALNAVRDQVHTVFQQVIETSPDEAEQSFTLNEEMAANQPFLRASGWPETEPAAELLARFATRSAIRHATPRGMAEINRLLPAVLHMTARSAQPLAALERLLALLEAIASRTVYLSLLAENTRILAQLVKMAIEGPWIIHYISRHPVLLDELLDTRRLHTPLTKTELKQELQNRWSAVDANDVEQILIVLRQFKQSNVLRVAAADLMGSIPVMVVSDYLTWIAEVLIDTVLTWAWQLTAERHPPPPGTHRDSPAQFGVIAYGKLGGIELGYSSDLDLVFLYDGDDEATDFFTRLVRRFIHLMTANTPAGLLYEIDLRLRPSGASGLLCSRVDAYAHYQMNKAWTWEQQALVKARFVAGDPHIAEAFGQIRHSVLSREREYSALRHEVLEMREKMRANMPPQSPLVFPLKQGTGGIVDIEFLVQFGVLSGAHDHPALTAWTDIIRLLDALAEVGFLSPDDAGFLKHAYCTLRERVHRAALQEIAAEVPITEYHDLRTRVSQIGQHLMGCDTSPFLSS